MGKTDKLDLRSALESGGWEIEQLTSDEWWAHAYWRLHSTWRPVGAIVYVTFLVDPMSTTSDAGSVWAISVGPTLPEDRITTQTTFRVKPRWPERMKEVVEAVGRLRST